MVNNSTPILPQNQVKETWPEMGDQFVQAGMVVGVWNVAA